MLVLSRKLGEEIWIDGGSIIVKVLEISSNKVRIGVSARGDIDIVRSEIAGRKNASDKQANRSTTETGEGHDPDFAT